MNIRLNSYKGGATNDDSGGDGDDNDGDNDDAELAAQVQGNSWHIAYCLASKTYHGWMKGLAAQQPPQLMFVGFPVSLAWKFVVYLGWEA